MKNIKNITIILMFTIIMLILGTTISNGAYSATSKTVNSGESFSVTVSSDTALEAYNLDLEGYNGLTFNGCSKTETGAIIQISGGSIGYMNVSGSTKTLGTYNFKAPTVTSDTNYTITFLVNKAKPPVTATITVKAPAPVTPTEPATPTEPTTPTTPTKSNNANLSNLGIRPNDFSGFRAANTSYNVSVPNDVSSIEVYATKGHSAQTITGTGNKTLNEGSNVFEVKVTAEDGTTKTYKITVVRLAQESEPTPDVDNSPVTKVALTSLNIKDVTLNEAFNPETTQYTATVDLSIEKLEIDAQANILDAKVEIQGADELKEGENIVKIILTSADGEDVKEYTIKVTKQSLEVIANNDEDNNEIVTIAGITDNNTPIMDNKTMILLGVLGACIIGVTVLTIILIIRNRKAKEDEDAIDFVGNLSTTQSLKNVKDSLEKLNNTNLEPAEEESTFIYKKKGRHF